jgi:SulP family sulfate permease
VPNPDGSKASQSRDFVGEGLGNLAGSFFQSMATGGSLSRTGISDDAAANSRLGGVFAGLRPVRSKVCCDGFGCV